MKHRQLVSTTSIKDVIIHVVHQLYSNLERQG